MLACPTVRTAPEFVLSPEPLPACLCPCPHACAPACMPVPLPACLCSCPHACAPARMLVLLPACVHPCPHVCAPACMPVPLPACLCPCPHACAPACMLVPLPACLCSCLHTCTRLPMPACSMPIPIFRLCGRICLNPTVPADAACFVHTPSYTTAASHYRGWRGLQVNGTRPAPNHHSTASAGIAL